jgi:hypothetical protein
MLAVVLLFLAAAVMLTLLGFVSSRRIGAVVGRVTRERHAAAEELLNTGRVPAAWLRRTSPAAADAASFAPTPAEKRRLLRRLDELARQFQHAPVFEDDESRTVVLDGFKEIRDRWAVDDWSGYPAVEAEPGQEQPSTEPR